jgi:tRNA-binding protein
MITYSDFEKVDIRVGEIIQAEDFPEARKPAYKLSIDFGAEIGIKNSSSQITHHYKKEDLIGMLVFAVVNFPVKKVGAFSSEVLTLGIYDENNDIVLAVPMKKVPKGVRLA